MQKPKFTKVSNMSDAIQTTVEFLEYHRVHLKETEPHATRTIDAIDEVLLGIPSTEEVIKSTK